MHKQREQFQVALELTSSEAGISPTPALSHHRNDILHEEEEKPALQRNKKSVSAHKGEVNFKKDLAMLDEEIEELQNSLDRAVAKFDQPVAIFTERVKEKQSQQHAFT